MKQIEINRRYKGGFSLFEGYKTIELIPEPKTIKIIFCGYGVMTQT